MTMPYFIFRNRINCIWSRRRNGTSNMCMRQSGKLNICNNKKYMEYYKIKTIDVTWHMRSFLVDETMDQYVSRMPVASQRWRRSVRATLDRWSLSATIVGSDIPCYIVVIMFLSIFSYMFLPIFFNLFLSILLNLFLSLLLWWTSEVTKLSSFAVDVLCHN